MSIAQLRSELHDLIEKADDRLLNLIYAMLQADMTDDDYQLSNDHKKILDERLKDHQKDPTSGSDWKSTKSRILDKL